ncbi:MAG TPA: GNAT family N-acetyltransferase [Acidimicrobiales bacterium]|nr:GNAT family N-acetyltransferase [Acidimicrobiales bacterium]
MTDPGLHLRAALADDLPFIQRMLYEATNRPGEDWPAFEASIHEPPNSRFWRDWTRQGDLGVVAERGGVPVGAAWLRIFLGEELGPWDDPGIPVVAIGVERFSRGVGVGRLLMRALIEVATTLGVPAVNLTTGTFNEAAVHLYHSCGFKDLAQQGKAVKMRLALANKPEPPVHDHPTQRGQPGPERLRPADSAEHWWQLQ